jgi:hypothetical protein
LGATGVELLLLLRVLLLELFQVLERFHFMFFFLLLFIIYYLFFCLLFPYYLCC